MLCKCVGRSTFVFRKLHFSIVVHLYVSGISRSWFERLLANVQSFSRYLASIWIVYFQCILIHKHFPPSRNFTTLPQGDQNLFQKSFDESTVTMDDSPSMPKMNIIMHHNTLNYICTYFIRLVFQLMLYKEKGHGPKKARKGRLEE